MSVKVHDSLHLSLSKERVGVIDTSGRSGRHHEIHSPIAISISVIITGKIVPSSCAIRQDFEWLVNAAEKILRVIRADPNERIDVLFYTGWWQAPHEIEHRVHWISHVEVKGYALCWCGDFTKCTSAATSPKSSMY